jgi:hypothetical protein
MRAIPRPWRSIFLILVLFSAVVPAHSQRTGYSREEFLRRRQALREKAKDGRIVLFGEDFKALVKSQTDDKYPGIYRMANFGGTAITEPPSKKEYPRAKMVKNFGDAAFKLKVGEVGLAVYDPKDSKYGWHIIKRLE